MITNDLGQLNEFREKQLLFRNTFSNCHKSPNVNPWVFKENIVKINEFKLGEEFGYYSEKMISNEYNGESFNELEPLKFIPKRRTLFTFDQLFENVGPDELCIDVVYERITGCCIPLDCFEMQYKAR